ncbi:MAG: hypothetical protein ACTHJ3_15180 [Pararhizobium sp.]
MIVVIFAANLLLHRALVESLLFSPALAVWLTPELLPAIVTVTLAHGARAMERNGVIVRRLAAIENLGSMDVLCTDKTGTLTEGVVRLDAAVDADGAPSAEVMLWATLDAAMETGLANPLDEAIRAAERFPAAEVGRHSKIDETPYDFVRKSLSVCRRDDAAEDLMVTKGALANILSFCGSIRSAGSVLPLGEAEKAALDDHLRAWSSASPRRGSARQELWAGRRARPRLQRFSSLSGHAEERRRGRARFEGHPHSDHFRRQPACVAPSRVPCRPAVPA